MSKKKLDLYLDGTIGFICPNCDAEISVRDSKKWIDDYKKQGAIEERSRRWKELWERGGKQFVSNFGFGRYDIEFVIGQAKGDIFNQTSQAMYACDFLDCVKIDEEDGTNRTKKAIKEVK
jgi:hypothetical protein